MPAVEILVHPELDGWRIYFSEPRVVKLILLTRRTSRFAISKRPSVCPVGDPAAANDDGRVHGPVRQAHERPGPAEAYPAFALCALAPELLRMR